MPIFDPSAAAASSAAGSGIFKLKAGVAIAPDDLVQLGPNGKAYPVKCTDYAAVANCNYGTQQTNAATGQIVAQTQIDPGATPATYRQAVVQGDDGSIFTFTQGNAPSANLTRYSAAGALVLQVAVTTGASNTGQRLFLLGNGNLCALWYVSGAVNFAIYDKNLNVVKAATSVGEATHTHSFFDACSLASGGFAVVYQQGANQLLSRLVTFDNAGNSVLAPTTVWTRTGTTGNQHHRMAQLSSGDLVIVSSSANTVSSIGLFHGIVTTGGASVLAFTNLDPVSYAYLPELSVMPGYYAVARANGTNQLGFVFNNAGVLQGANFSSASTSVASLVTKLVNDGTAFYLIWPRNSDAKEVLTKMPVTGTGYVTTVITTTGAPNNFNNYLDAFCENGFIVGISLLNTGAATNQILWVVNVVTGQLVSAANTFFGSSATTGGSMPRVIPGGDFSFIGMYDQQATAATHLCVGKYANTAIMGVAQTAAAADDMVEVAAPASGYATNYIKGSPAKVFDHSATNIVGNKGALLNYGAVLKGL